MNLRKNITLSQVELKFAPEGTKTFSGYASVFGGVDSYNDTIVKGAYNSVIEKINNGDFRMPKMFVNHKSWDIPVGKWTKLEEDDKGLYMEGELTPGNPQSDIIKAGMVHETIDGLSIGFQIGDFEIVQKGDTSLRLIKSIKELPEVSIVTYPADDNARVDLTSVKSSLDNVKNIRDFENFLRDACGFSKNLATATASRAKSLFTQGDPDVENELPNDLKRLIALNLLSARSL
jgi:HK97 family phage prohead protease